MASLEWPAVYGSGCPARKSGLGASACALTGIRPHAEGGAGWTGGKLLGKEAAVLAGGRQLPAGMMDEQVGMMDEQFEMLRVLPSLAGTPGSSSTESKYLRKLQSANITHAQHYTALHSTTQHYTAQHYLPLGALLCLTVLALTFVCVTVLTLTSVLNNTSLASYQLWGEMPGSAFISRMSRQGHIPAGTSPPTRPGPHSHPRRIVHPRSGFHPTSPMTRTSDSKPFPAEQTNA
jgi:hypothetical protein